MMYRLVSVISVFLFSAVVYGEIRIPSNYINVVADKKDKKVEKGWCRIKGVVYEAGTKNKVANILIAEHTGQRYGYSNAEGVVDFLVKETDSILYSFHSSYGEIIAAPYDFKSGHTVSIEVVLGEQRPEGEWMIEAEKPVVYMYSEAPISASVQIDFLGELTFTYPLYENGWDVQLDKQGIKVDDTKYPYLFWEGNLKMDFVANNGELEGYYIDTDSTVRFLENQLTLLGLNNKEQTDFITYWAPRIKHYNYATVQFLVDNVCAENIGELKIHPQPDVLRRVYMLFEGSNVNLPQKKKLSPQKEVKQIQRKGFTVVEWGGSELIPTQLVEMN